MPCPGTTFAFTHFDDVRLAGMIRRYPIEAVAAKIHQPAARGEIILHPVEHSGGVVLGMSTGEHDLVRAKESGAFAMEVLVGDDVVVEAARFEPIDQMQIGR